MEEQNKSVQVCEIPAPVVNRTKLGQFPPGVSGNPPGRPKGAKNKATVVREMLISCANRETARIFRQRLRRPQDKVTFTKSMDQLIALLGPSKPFAVVDQSQHTHFTVIVPESIELNQDKAQ